MLLYYITDRSAFPGTEGEQREMVIRRIAEAARAGVDYIQLREKDLSARELQRLANQAVWAVRENSKRTKLLINGRTDIALACGADGVHLPADDLPASEVRAVWMKCSDRHPVIGVSTHSAADVRLAFSYGANFAVLAPIFEKPKTAVKGLGLEVLREVCSGMTAANRTDDEDFALLALGGVNLDNAGACLAAGVSGIAGIRLFQRGSVENTVERLRSLSKHLPEASLDAHHR